MTEIIQYKCPNCGGRVEFNSSTQNMKCPYCDSEFAVEEASVEKEQSAKGTSIKDMETGLKTYICQSCGGELVTDESTSAAVCPFCESPVVLSERISGAFRPDQLIPFKISKEAAQKALLEYYKGKIYLPDAFVEKNHLDEIKGVYVPYWVYNLTATAQGGYKCRKETSHRREDRDGYWVITDSAVYDVMRTGNIRFKNIPVDASPKMDDRTMEALEPFDFRGAVPFDAAYLSGFSADRYDETGGALMSRVKDRIEKDCTYALAQTIRGYDTAENTSIEVSISQAEKPIYMLCPVWILNTSFGDEKYRFVVNGQTGKIAGKLPIDVKKKRKMFRKDFFLFGGIAAVIWAIIWIVDEIGWWLFP